MSRRVRCWVRRMAVPSTLGHGRWWHRVVLTRIGARSPQLEGGGCPELSQVTAPDTTLRSLTCTERTQQGLTLAEVTVREQYLPDSTNPQGAPVSTSTSSITMARRLVAAGAFSAVLALGVGTASAQDEHSGVSPPTRRPATP